VKTAKLLQNILKECKLPVSHGLKVRPTKVRLITVPLLTGLPCIYFSSCAKGKADENKINNSMTRNICMVAKSIVVLLSILFSSALLLANDEKFMHGNPVNSGTVINIIVVSLTIVRPTKIRLITVPLLTGLPCIYFSSWAKGKTDEGKINNSTTIDWVTMHIFLVMG
jgi:hypothetical protein